MKIYKCWLVLILVLIVIFSASCQFLPAQQPATTSSQPLQVAFLDVGQADSIAIQCDNSRMLIDAGTNASTNSLISKLKNMGINKFDVVVGTHPHEDHIGGMDAVINQFNIGKIYMPKVSDTTKTFEDVMKAISNKGLSITTPVPGTSFNLGSATCTILAPNSASYEDLNNYSIVIRLLYGSTSFLSWATLKQTRKRKFWPRDTP